MLTARVLGHGWTLMDDIEACPPVDMTIAVNRAAVAYTGPIDHWVTLHPEEMPHWEKLRAQAGGPGGYRRWSRRQPPPGPELSITSHQWGGGSGLLAVRVALVELGCDAVYLCGMPMDDGPHWGEVEAWRHPNLFRPDWERVADRLRGKVVSLSGWTRDLLGGPEVWGGD